MLQVAGSLVVTSDEERFGNSIHQGSRLPFWDFVCWSSVLGMYCITLGNLRPQPRSPQKVVVYGCRRFFSGVLKRKLLLLVAYPLPDRLGDLATFKELPAKLLWKVYVGIS